MYKKTPIVLTLALAFVALALPTEAGALTFSRKKIAVYQNVRLENNLAESAWDIHCPDPRMLIPAPGEYGHWSSVRLTPERYPFILQTIAYDIITDYDMDCDANTPHEVAVFIGNSMIPDAVPEFLGFFDGPSDHPATEGPHRAIIRLDDSIELLQGEYLFISIEMAREDNNMVCLTFCGSLDVTPGANYWSNSTDTPYDWQALEEFFGSHAGDVRVMAYGRQFAFWYYP